MPNKKLWDGVDGIGIYAQLAKHAIKDANGNDIDSTYATKESVKAKQDTLTFGYNSNSQIVSIDNHDLAPSTDSTVYLAHYTVTTGANIKDALNSNKAVMCKSGTTDPPSFGLLGSYDLTNNKYQFTIIKKTTNVYEQAPGDIKYSGVFCDGSSWFGQTSSLTFKAPTSDGQVMKSVKLSNGKYDWALSTINGIPSSTASDADKVLTVNAQGTPVWTTVQGYATDPTIDDSLLLGQSDGSKTWTALNRDVFGTALIDEETGLPMLDEGQSAVYDMNSTDQLWTSFAGHEFGARRAYEDQNGDNIVATYATKDSLARVASTGSYNDLTDKPTIPPGAIVDQQFDATSTNAQSGKAVAEAVGDKADKVSGASNGHLASLDANGNLKDSGKLVSDFATDAQGAKADSSLQGVKVNGTELPKDGSNVVDVTVPTSSNAEPLMDGNASAGSATTYSKSDHVHPSDTSREAVANKDSSIPTTPVSGHYPSTEAVANFVNSSIATNTANFLGTYDVVSDLGLTTSATNAQIASALNSFTFPTGTTVTNNDYVFVSINYSTTTDVDEFRRFKYSAGTPNGSWAYEYTLNNSSYTQAQWDAINSGATATKIGNYDAHLIATNNPHAVTAAQIGLGNVGNFKAVSTVAGQGLDSTEQSNARANIGAGTYTKDVNGIPDSDIASASSWNNKADKATNLTGATKTKITYNSQGIVTAGADLEASDIPTSLPDVTAGVHSFHFSSGGIYKLATITFDENGSNSAVYMGCQIALSYRIGGGNGTGSGLLGISFSEWSNGHWAKSPEGTFTLLNARSYSGVTSNPINLYVRKVTNWEYILYVDTSTDTEISFSLSSGEVMSFDVPSTVTTMASETGDISVVWATNVSAYGTCETWDSFDPSYEYAIIAETTFDIGSTNNGDGSLLQFEYGNSDVIKLKLGFWSSTTQGVYIARVFVLESTKSLSWIQDCIAITYHTYTSNNTATIHIYVKCTGHWQIWRVRQLDCQTGDGGYTNWRPWTFYQIHGTKYSRPLGTSATYIFTSPIVPNDRADTTAGVGDKTTGVYVDSDGVVKALPTPRAYFSGQTGYRRLVKIVPSLTAVGDRVIKFSAIQTWAGSMAKTYEGMIEIRYGSPWAWGYARETKFSSNAGNIVLWYNNTTHEAYLVAKCEGSYSAFNLRIEDCLDLNGVHKIDDLTAFYTNASLETSIPSGFSELTGA